MTWLTCDTHQSKNSGSILASGHDKYKVLEYAKLYGSASPALGEHYQHQVLWHAIGLRPSVNNHSGPATTAFPPARVADPQIYMSRCLEIYDNYYGYYSHIVRVGTHTEDG
jgi:hypothetical protein